MNYVTTAPTNPHSFNSPQQVFFLSQNPQNPLPRYSEYPLYARYCSLPPIMVTAKPQPAPAASSSSYTAPPPRNRFGENLPKGILPRLPPVDPRPRPIRDFISTRLYKLVLATLYLVYSVYLKLRWTYHTALNRGFSILYYHHRTPQLIQQDVMEVKANGKLPKHLSVILEYEKGGLDTLIDEVAEITCWCASAGIKHLSVYEQTGMPSPLL